MQDDEIGICDASCTCPFCLQEAAEAAQEEREVTPRQQELIDAEAARQAQKKADEMFAPDAEDGD